MLNLDWFQPFDGTSHSTEVLYAAICNLPRDIRFKRENLLIISILPGPNEVSLHKINHYLTPMVDELESLWSGMTLNRTYKYQEGRQIRAALILVSCDIPAARKICGHISRSEEHTSELQSRSDLVCRLLLEKKKNAYEIV